MNNPEKEKQQRIMAIAMAVVALLFSWVIFYRGPNNELARQEKAITQAQADALPPSLALTATPQTVQAAKLASAPLSHNELVARVQSAAKRSGSDVIDASGAGSVISIKISGPRLYLTQFYGNLLSDVHFLSDGQIAGSQPMIVVDDLKIASSTPTSSVLTADVSSAGAEQ